MYSDYILVAEVIIEDEERMCRDNYRENCVNSLASIAEREGVLLCDCQSRVVLVGYSRALKHVVGCSGSDIIVDELYRLPLRGDDD